MCGTLSFFILTGCLSSGAPYPTSTTNTSTGSQTTPPPQVQPWPCSQGIAVRNNGEQDSGINIGNGVAYGIPIGTLLYGNADTARDGKYSNVFDIETKCGNTAVFPAPYASEKNFVVEATPFYRDNSQCHMEISPAGDLPSIKFAPSKSCLGAYTFGHSISPSTQPLTSPYDPWGSSESSLCSKRILGKKCGVQFQFNER